MADGARSLRWQNSGIELLFFFFEGGGGVNFSRRIGPIFSPLMCLGKETIQMHDSLDILEVTMF